jgi:hypothetical protein
LRAPERQWRTYRVRFSLAYCPAVRFNHTPPRPVSIPWFSACLLSRSLNAPPRSASSLILSAFEKVSLRGRGVFKSASRNGSTTHHAPHEVHVNPMASLVGVPVAHVIQYRQTKGEYAYGINRYSTAVAKLLGWRLLAFSR